MARGTATSIALITFSLVVRVNLSTLISELYGFVRASTPKNASMPFVLKTMAPVKELLIMDATVGECGLSNSVIIQRPTQ